ncbi:hypothetical protein CCMA1212_005901 [Trichoderma ghanense]|uniref:Uncharacterized protein n=1 Tax=Trichoderma ghanense TaxID=65468 RepID=A0ABY2H1P4_9HYPO
MISLTSFHCSYPQLLQNRLVAVGPFVEIFFSACPAWTVIDRSRARVTRPVMIFFFDFFSYPFPPSWSRVPSVCLEPSRCYTYRQLHKCDGDELPLPC